jgi:hypothetical protein
VVLAGVAEDARAVVADELAPFFLVQGGLLCNWPEAATVPQKRRRWLSPDADSGEERPADRAAPGALAAIRGAVVPLVALSQNPGRTGS